MGVGWKSSDEQMGSHDSGFLGSRVPCSKDNFLDTSCSMLKIQDRLDVSSVDTVLGL